MSHPANPILARWPTLAEELDRTDRLITALSFGWVPAEFMHDDLVAVYLELARDVAALDRTPNGWPSDGVTPLWR